VFLVSYEDGSDRTIDDVALWDGWAVARSDGAVETWGANYTPMGRVTSTVRSFGDATRDGRRVFWNGRRQPTDWGERRLLYPQGRRARERVQGGFSTGRSGSD
jgi:hypothetical protein